MENEIDLKELILIAWRGKYIIIAITLLAMLLTAGYSFLLAVPTYEYSVRVDPTLFEVTPAEVQQLYGGSQLILDAVKEIDSENPAEVAAAVKVEAISNTDYFLIVATHRDNRKSIEIANQVGIAILEQLQENHSETLRQRKERLDRDIAGINEIIDDLFPREDDRFIVYTPPQGGAYTGMHPVYERLLREKGSRTIELLEALFEIALFEDKMIVDPAVLIMDGSQKTHAANKKVNIALSFVFGLALSIIVVFMHHYIVNSWQKETQTEGEN